MKQWMKLICFQHLLVWASSNYIFITQSCFSVAQQYTITSAEAGKTCHLEKCHLCCTIQDQSTLTKAEGLGTCFIHGWSTITGLTMKSSQLLDRKQLFTTYLTMIECVSNFQLNLYALLREQTHYQWHISLQSKLIIINTQQHFCYSLQDQEVVPLLANKRSHHMLS